MAEKKLSSTQEKFSYSLGMSVSSNLIKSGVVKVDFPSLFEGIKDTFEGNMPQVMPEEANKIIEDFINQSAAKAGDKNLEEGLAFLAENKAKEGVVELPSGLQYMVIKQGDGELATSQDNVKCHYHGTLIDGTVFDSSVERGEPATFPVNGVIQGWVEALQLMPVGSKWRLFIPSELAYGQRGAGGAIGPNSTLIFDVDLLEIV